MTAPADERPDDRLADENTAVLLGQARWILRDLHFKHPECGYGKMAAGCEVAQLDILRRSTSSSATVLGVTREVLQRVIAAAMASSGSQAKNAADAVFALLTPAPAVTQPEPEASPTREEEAKDAAARIWNGFLFDVDEIKFATSLPGQERRVATLADADFIARLALGLNPLPESDPPPSPVGASVEVPEKIVRDAYRLFQHDAEFPCSASAMGEAIRYAIGKLALAPQDGAEQIRRERDAFCKAFEETCDALDCKRDNEAALARIDDLLATELRASALEAQRDSARRRRDAAIAGCDAEGEAHWACRDKLEATEARLADATRLLERVYRPGRIMHTFERLGGDIAAFLAGAGPRVEPVNDGVSAFPNRPDLESEPIAGPRVAGRAALLRDERTGR